jgi:hypothetical protein
VAWQTTPILDSGTGVDQSPLSGNWASAANLEANQWQRLSNQFAPVATPSAARWTATTFGAAQEVYCTIPTIQNGSGIYIALYARGNNLATGSASYYQAFFAGTAVAGAFNMTLQNQSGAIGSAVALTLANNDVIGLRTVGTEITVWQNQTLLLKTYNSTNTGTGQVAMSATGANWRVSNFGGGDYVLPAPLNMNWIRFPKHRLGRS